MESAGLFRLRSLEQENLSDWVYFPDWLRSRKENLVVILVNTRIRQSRIMPGKGGLVRRVPMREISRNMPKGSASRSISSVRPQRKKVYRKGDVNRFDSMGRHENDGHQKNELSPVMSGENRKRRAL
jgi:hypothetical protein